MAEVRQRKANGTTAGKDSSATPQTSSRPPVSSIKVTDVLRILGGLVLLNCALSYFITNDTIAWGWRPWFSKPSEVKAWLSGPVRLTDQQLLAYDGTDPNKPIYVALNGSIYDVSAGRHMYGPGGSYSFFAGKDATRAFVTGCFDTDLTPDMRGVEMMYIPKDDDDAAEIEGEDGEVTRKGGAKGVPKAELKTRREREYRVARKKVADTIEGWSTMFRGDGGKAYFKAGEVVRPPGWLEKLPRRKLCERAEGLRPKRKP